MSQTSEVNEDPIAFFKIGQKQHMLELFHEGHVFLNTVGYFKNLEEVGPRSDPDETSAYCHQMDGGTIEIQEGSEWLALGTIIGGVRLYDEALARANIYCLHARGMNQCKEPWKLDYLGFGDTFVFFFNLQEFLQRLRYAATEAGYRIEWRQVEYVDRRTFNGPMGPFRKFSERADEREFRILIQPGIGAPMSFRLGSLADIAVIGNASNRLKLIEKDGPTTSQTCR